MDYKEQLIYQLREAVKYIESMQESISTNFNETAEEWIYSGMDNALEFDLDEAKAILVHLDLLEYLKEAK